MSFMSPILFRCDSYPELLNHSSIISSTDIMTTDHPIAHDHLCMFPLSFPTFNLFPGFAHDIIYMETRGDNVQSIHCNAATLPLHWRTDRKILLETFLKALHLVYVLGCVTNLVSILFYYLLVRILVTFILSYPLILSHLFD